MEIRVIELRRLDGSTKTKGFASVAITLEFGVVTIREWKILDHGNGLLVIPPQVSWWDVKTQTKTYREIIILPREIKAKVTEVILAEYNK